MDKQQATEIFNKLDLTSLSPEDLIIAGWEAREAQAPSDAVVPNLTEIENLLREYYTKNKEGKGGGYGLRLLKSIANPSGAAPQAEIDPLELSDLRESMGLPPAAGQLGRDNAILVEALEEMGKGPLQFRPQTPAGPVWVKANKRLPDKNINLPARYNGKHFNMFLGDGGIYVNLMKCHSLKILEEDFPGIEWLDESGSSAPAQQVFNRGQVLSIVIKGWFDLPDTVQYNDIKEWFNTNYPPLK